MTLLIILFSVSETAAVSFSHAGRVEQRGLARSGSDWASAGPVAVLRFGQTRGGVLQPSRDEGVSCYSPAAKQDEPRGPEGVVKEFDAEAAVEAPEKRRFVSFCLARY